MPPARPSSGPRRRPRRAPWRAALLTAVLAAAAPAQALSERLVFADDFSAGLTRWQDLSTAVTWDPAPPDGSAFEVVDGAARLNAAAAAAGSSYTGERSLKTFTALDVRFPAPLDRTEAAVTVEFRARWHDAKASGDGEYNRLVILFNHDYPPGGLDLARDRRAGDFSRAWWARPAYNVRIRGGSGPNAEAIQMYGGGGAAANPGPEDYLGEYEATAGWWLPGFVAAPGGVSPGSGADWPDEGWTQSAGGLAANVWQRFRFVVTPDAIEFWRDATDSGAEWVRHIVQPTPRVGQQPGTAPLYNYFERLEGLRFYWRNAPGTGRLANVELDDVRVTQRPLADRPHNAWLAAHFSEAELGDYAGGAALWEDAADPDGDGLPNLLERALALDPRAPDRAAGLRAAPAAGGGLTLRFRQAKDLAGLTLALEESADLRAWAPSALAPATVGDAGAAWEREAVLPGGAGARYLRLVLARERLGR